jgi:hypothetical protein
LEDLKGGLVGRVGELGEDRSGEKGGEGLVGHLEGKMLGMGKEKGRLEGREGSSHSSVDEQVNQKNQTELKRYYCL